MKISLALIVAPTDDEAKKLNNCLASVAQHVDEICITITGENKKVEKVAKSHKAKISHFEWIDDFAAARNYNFSQCTGDWILWLDADDIMWQPEKLKKFIRLAEGVNVSGLQIYYEYGHADDGTVTDGHWKTQLVKNDGHAHWKGAIHEDLLQKRQVLWSQIPREEMLRVHTAKKDDNIAHHERNLRILEKEQARDPEEPRTYIYLGRSYIATEQFEKALEALSTFVMLSGWDEERYEAKCLMGEVYERLNDSKNALAAYNDALLEDEQCPKAHVLKARVYISQEKYRQALTSLEIAQQIRDPKPGIMQLPTLMGRDMYGMAAICHLHLGDYDEALRIAKIAQKHDPRGEHSRELVKICQQMNDDEQLTLQFITLLKWFEQKDAEKVPHLVSALPDSIKDDPRLQRFYMKPQEWSDNSVTIFCGISAETWLPGSENSKGIGGSETAVIELAKRLVKMGREVTVYNDCAVGPEGVVVDGVRYMNHWQFNKDDKFNVLWIWRMPAVLDLNVEAKQIVLDMHDVSSADEFTPERVEKVDKIFVKTDYHRTLYPDVPDEKFVIVGNGIDLDRFNQKVERNPHKIIYSSTPNRGLENILDMWPQIKEGVPDAELHIFYGWNTFYELEKDNPVQMEWMQTMKKKMNQPDIYNHGRVGQKELAKEMLSSGFWLYPTEFPEIHCITACEMQAAGVYPMTTGFAALAETQKVGYTQIGDPKDEKWRKKYVETVVERMNEGVDHEATKEAARDFSWDDVAKVWHHELR